MIESPRAPKPSLYAGVMTGTSMDGIDLSLISVDNGRVDRLDFAQADLPPRLRQLFTELHDPEMPGALLRAAEAGVALAREISLLVRSRLDEWRRLGPLRAIGVHGQTVLHRPERGVTIQVNAPAWIAEQTGVDVVSDFRVRDIAAGGQGAPLVPVFHEVMTRNQPGGCMAIVNLGGIANISCIRRDEATGKQHVSGFDTGPANILLDYWTQKSIQQPYDRDGAFARQALPDPRLLARMGADPFFALPGPKSTGRDHFNGQWLESHLAAHRAENGPITPAEVQATLAALTIETVARSVPRDASAVYLCGGGANNGLLREGIGVAIAKAGGTAPVETTEALGWPTQEVEAAAFAWLAHCCITETPASLPEVTGAKGPRVLGSISPAGPI